MKQLIINIIVNLIISGGVITDKYYNLAFAGNISIFIAWTIIILSILTAFIHNKEKAKARPKNSFRLIKRILTALTIVCMIAVGNVFTAIFMIIGMLFLYTAISDNKDATT